ncbi:hypothetical protein DASB73_020400 [Starmerella bacillaris]|uniref:C2H2-type domain-containing protein n=1 Tax=Starmerella bacillaris TaxID=1247836 RepID=A0AAV5RJ80_STABA|nr:hypothetical protein DASB73_020400 [Starmerella bacillaris]
MDVQFKLGRSGFRCESCNLTFNDNIKYIDHTHSPSHVQKTGALPVKKASLEEVKERIEYLAEVKGLK